MFIFLTFGTSILSDCLGLLHFSIAGFPVIPSKNAAMKCTVNCRSYFAWLSIAFQEKKIHKFGNIR
jgi:hypothetical protein